MRSIHDLKTVFEVYCNPYELMVCIGYGEKWFYSVSRFSEETREHGLFVEDEIFNDRQDAVEAVCDALRDVVETAEQNLPDNVPDGDKLTNTFIHRIAGELRRSDDVATCLLKAS